MCSFHTSNHHFFFGGGGGMHLRVIHVTLGFTVRPLPLCFSFLLLWRWFIRRGGRLGQGTSLYNGRCLCRLLWQRCHPLTLWRTAKKHLFTKTGINLRKGRYQKYAGIFSTHFFRHIHIQYRSLDWLLGGGWQGAGPLLVEKKHLIGWVPRMGPMNARGRLELTGALRWSTLQRKTEYLLTVSNTQSHHLLTTPPSCTDITFKRKQTFLLFDCWDVISLFGESEPFSTIVFFTNAILFLS